MTTEVAPLPNIAKQHPEEYLLQCDIGFIFTNLTHNGWHINKLLLRRRADFFAYTPDKKSACVGFYVTKKNADKVRDIFCRIQNWKSVVVTVRGHKGITPQDYKGWLPCWLTAMYWDDPLHCRVDEYNPLPHAGPQPWDAKIKQYRLTLPCKNVRWRPDIKHPETFELQYMQAAHKSGCDKCPLFTRCGFTAREATLEEVSPPRLEDLIFKYLKEHK